MPTILIVEDQPDIAKILEIRLGFAGYDVIHAATSEGAKPILLSGRADALVTDLYLAPGTGMELLEWLHAQDLPRIPVALMTAALPSAKEDDRARAWATLGLFDKSDLDAMLEELKRAVPTVAPLPI